MESKDLAVPRQRAIYFPASVQFSAACAAESTRHCVKLSECAGPLPAMIADAYLMGGEL